MTLVADALYAKTKLLKWCIKKNVKMITRLRSDAALYAPLRKSKKGTRGRPAVKSKTAAGAGCVGTTGKEVFIDELKTVS